MDQRLTHARTGDVLAVTILWARSWRSRMRGLLGSTLAPGEALILEPGKQVHTFFMGYPIDVLFCDARDRVVFVASMQPWRVSRWVAGSAYIVELPDGRASRVVVGDLLEL